MGTGFAQPKPVSTSSTVPMGSRCAIGFRVILPCQRAVESPNLLAAQAWANSWTGRMKKATSARDKICNNICWTLAPLKKRGTLTTPYRQPFFRTEIFHNSVISIFIIIQKGPWKYKGKPLPSGNFTIFLKNVQIFLGKGLLLSGKSDKIQMLTFC